MSAPSTLDVLATLRQGLDETARALAQADLPQLLAAESSLQSALATLASNCTVTRGDRAALAELQRIQHSLTVCRRLGAALNDFVGMSGAPAITGPLTHTFRHSA